MISNAFRRTLKLFQALRARVGQGFWQQLLLTVKRPLACRRGCSNCCYQPLTVSLLDGILVYQWLADNHLWTSTLKRRFEETADRTNGLALEVWLLSMTPCPLLDEETKVCRAYKGRPFPCRVAFAHDSYYCHPHRFAEALQHSSSKTDLRQSTFEELWRLEAGLLKRHRWPRIGLPFASAVLHGEAVCTTSDSYEDRLKIIWVSQLKGGS